MTESTNELRIEIWDILYRAEDQKSIAEIAGLVNQDAEVVRDAVNHEWFTTHDDVVSISHAINAH